MRVTIWDLDYYYSKNKVNCFNPDVMKISSYHKQLGDEVNFVEKDDDIYRPHDIYYIIKENSKTPNPPYEFYLNPKVKWWGNAVFSKVNWKMPNAMLACRPDYLIYPEKNTQLERAEQIRLLDNQGRLMPLVQDWTNVFKRKRALVIDDNLWTTDSENLKKALIRLQEVKNVTFFKPIWIQKLFSDKDIMSEFLQLKLVPGCNLQWLEINTTEYERAKDVILAIKKVFPDIAIGALPIRFSPHLHWENRENALKDFNEFKRIIVDAKKNNIKVKIKKLRHRLDSPYFFVFEAMADWTEKFFELSWLEYITKIYGKGLQFDRNVMFWSRPKEWPEPFRDLLRQTWEDKDFLLCKIGTKSLSENDIPWAIWKETFKYEI